MHNTLAAAFILRILRLIYNTITNYLLFFRLYTSAPVNIQTVVLLTTE